MFARAQASAPGHDAISRLSKQFRDTTPPMPGSPLMSAGVRVSQRLMLALKKRYVDFCSGFPACMTSSQLVA
jgi:hypothetical protein